MRARFCNNCGARQNRSQPATDHQGRAKLYADIAHPINPECREEIQNCVLDEFEKEKERSRQPGYISNYDDIYESSHSRKSSSAKRAGATESAQRTDEGESPGKGMHRRSHDSQSSSKSQGDGELKEGTDFGNGIF
jgi:stage V sporulation protein G